MHYEGTIIRPPSEANSIILQVTVGCSHNHCTFCGAYKDVRFRVKSDDEIDRDLAFASTCCLRQNRVFLADGDALILPQRTLTALFLKIRRQLPRVNRISLYGNARAVRSKSSDDLATLKEYGLDRIYMGVESGDDTILCTVRKGESFKSLLLAGRKVLDAGIFLSTTVLLGLGGKEKSADHALHTASLLSSMQPNQIATLTLIPLDNTVMGTQVLKGEFHLPEPLAIMAEIRLLVEHLEVNRSQFMANHASNYLPISGRLPRDKDKILRCIDAALHGQTSLIPESFRSL